MTSSNLVTSTLEFPYRRSLGTVVGGFALGLREHKILGSRTNAGEVLVPPLEYDPNSGEPVADELVPVGPGGEVVSWTWVSDPTDRHPLDHPFAFALIKLDGASTSLVHALDVASPGDVSTGMRVEPRWSPEPKGVITDIEAFVAEGTAPEVEIKKAPIAADGEEPKADDPIVIDAMITLTYSEPLPPATVRFAEALVEGRILGAKSTGVRSDLRPDPCLRPARRCRADPGRRRRGVRQGRGDRVHDHHAGPLLRPDQDRAVHLRVGAARRRRHAARRPGDHRDLDRRRAHRAAGQGDLEAGVGAHQRGSVDPRLGHGRRCHLLVRMDG